MRELDLVDEVLSVYLGKGHNNIVERVRGCMADLLNVMVSIIGQENGINIDKNVFVILSKALKSKNADELALTPEEITQFSYLNLAFKYEKFIEAIFTINILCGKNTMAREIVNQIQQNFSASCLGLAALQERNAKTTVLRFSSPTELQKFAEIKKQRIGEAAEVCREVLNLRAKYGI